jgi:F0F1-type ATP synthase membrane subunit b/b'
LRAEISHLSAVATTDAVRAAMDDRTQQELVDNFIVKVGASR